MHIPAALRERRAERIEGEFRKALGNSQLNLRPRTYVRPNSSFYARDVIGDWDLRCEGGEANRRQTKFRDIPGKGARVVHALATVNNSPDTWEAISSAHWNFGVGKSWGITFWARFLARATGGYFISNLKGPAADDPWAPGGAPHFGSDRGYGASSNSDGGLGFGIYGDAVYLNTDTDLDEWDHADRRWRCYTLGYDVPAKTGYLTCKDFNIAHTTGVEIGDTTSEDGIFALRARYYGQSLCGGTCEIAGIMAFVDDDDYAWGNSLWLNRIDLMTALQRDLE